MNVDGDASAIPRVGLSRGSLTYGQTERVRAAVRKKTRRESVYFTRARADTHDIDISSVDARKPRTVL